MAKQSKTPNSHSEPTGDESLSNLARDISLSLNMTNPISHSVLDTESVNANYKLINPHHYKQYLSNLIQKSQYFLHLSTSKKEDYSKQVTLKLTIEE